MKRSDATATEVLADRYEIRDEIGRGAIATVFRARDRRLGREVAIKLLEPALRTDPLIRGRFESAANATACISNRNVVAIFDTNQRDAVPFIVMECLPGVTLADELRRGALPPDRVQRIALDVLNGLGAAHELGVVHGDIKPSNLLVADDGTIKLADFGIAESFTATDCTASGRVIAYAAPERLEGRPATDAGDLYSLGVVLYECATGRKPFADDTPPALVQSIITAEPQPIGAARSGIGEVLARVIERAIARLPEDRYASPAELTAALRQPDGEPTPLTPDGEPTLLTPVVRRGSTGMPGEAEDAALAATRLGNGTRRLETVAPRARPRRHLRLAGVLVAMVGVAVVALLVLGSNTGGSVGGSPAPTVASSVPPARSVPALPAQLARDLQQLEQTVRP